jgi:hypothetical protein
LNDKENITVITNFEFKATNKESWLIFKYYNIKLRGTR